jgi:hypothetical protein
VGLELSVAFTHEVSMNAAKQKLSSARMIVVSSVVALLLIVLLRIQVVPASLAEPAAALSIVEVAAPAIHCIFDPDCSVAGTDTADHFVLAGTVGDAFLQTRTLPQAESGTEAEGLFGYEYRIDLRQLAGILHIPCVTSFSIEFGPVTPLNYDGNGEPDDVFVITSGGLGAVAPTTADKVGNTITFSFAPGVCAGGSPGHGDSTFFFGLASSSPPHEVVAPIRDTEEIEYDLEARAPAFPIMPGGRSLHLDGSGAYVMIPFAHDLNSLTAITIEAWVKRSTRRCETVVGNGWLQSYWLGFCTGPMRFYHGSGQQVAGAAAIPAGQWIHIAVTYDGQTRRYYVNGELDLTSTDQSGSLVQANQLPLYIGADRDGG